MANGAYVTADVVAGVPATITSGTAIPASTSARTRRPSASYPACAATSRAARSAMPCMWPSYQWRPPNVHPAAMISRARATTRPASGVPPVRFMPLLRSMNRRRPEPRHEATCAGDSTRPATSAPGCSRASAMIRSALGPTCGNATITSRAPRASSACSSSVVAHLKRVSPASSISCMTAPSFAVFTCGRQRGAPPATPIIAARFARTASASMSRAGVRRPAIGAALTPPARSRPRCRSRALPWRCAGSRRGRRRRIACR